MALLVAVTQLNPFPAGVPALVCAVIFLIGAVWDWRSRHDASPGMLKDVGLWLLRLGWVLLTGALAYEGLSRNVLPIHTTADLLLSLAWGLGGLALFIDLAFEHHLPVWVIGSVMAACLLISSCVGGEAQVFTSSEKPLILLHIGAAILAYCLLIAQGLNALAYLLQDRALASRQFGGIYDLLPALVPIDRMGASLLGAAVWMLGLSLVIGSVDWFSISRSLVTLPKLIMGLLTLAGGLFLVIQRRRFALGGAQFARGSLWLLLPALLALWLSLPATR